MKTKTTYNIMNRSEWQSFYNELERETFSVSLSLRKRLNYCQAYIYPVIIVDDVSYIPLVSYDTLIAVYDKTNDYIISFGYFSSTSTGHFSKFREYIRLTYRTSPTYKHGLYENEMTYYLYRNERGYYGEVRNCNYYRF